MLKSENREDIMIGAGGFFSAITKPLRGVTNALVGGGGGTSGGGSAGYVSPNIPKRDEALQQGITDRSALGFKPLTGAEGVQTATAGFNLGGANQAIQELGSAGKFEGSNPYQFNFQHLPDMYNKLAYARGSQNIRREGATGLQNLKQAVGNRRPGLLAQLGQNQQRATGENLAGLQSDLGLKQMEQDVDLGRQQQTYQADENYRTLQAQDEARRARLASLGEIGTKVPALESDLLEAEREYRDKPLDYLRDVYGIDLGQSQAAAQRQTEQRGQNARLLTGIGSAFIDLLEDKR